jgi:predicted Fe-S protein YdhL (DUF1289 family)
MEIPSPCTGLCKLAADRRACESCGRTTGEIAEWLIAEDLRKQEILDRLRLRALKSKG